MIIIINDIETMCCFRVEKPDFYHFNVIRFNINIDQTAAIVTLASGLTIRLTAKFYVEWIPVK
jgi:hypothetical protein